MGVLTTASVRAFFEAEAHNGRRLLPDPATASGMGTFAKYRRATALMAEPGVAAVLDVGCSVGSIEALFHQQQPARAAMVDVEGVDITAEAIRHARALALPRCGFRVYDGADLPYDDDRFDLAVAIEVIEHVPDKAALLAEIWRVLRPGGRCFLTTPNPACWALRAEERLERVARRCARRALPEKDDFIAGNALSTLLRDAGFEPAGSGTRSIWPRLHVSLFGWGVLPPLPPRALAGYQRLCVAALGEDGPRGSIGARLGWTTSALWRKPFDAADAPAPSFGSAFDSTSVSGPTSTHAQPAAPRADGRQADPMRRSAGASS